MLEWQERGARSSQGASHLSRREEKRDCGLLPRRHRAWRPRPSNLSPFFRL